MIIPSCRLSHLSRILSYLCPFKGSRAYSIPESGQSGRFLHPPYDESGGYEVQGSKQPAVAFEQIEGCATETRHVSWCAARRCRRVGPRKGRGEERGEERGESAERKMVDVISCPLIPQIL